MSRLRSFLACLVLTTAVLPGLVSAQVPLTREDLEPFLDGVVPVALRRHDIAGAVIAVVKDGQILLAKGYGYSDLAHRKPVSPDSTLFRVASISKTFNATAVMQLVEQGRLDLDHDIQEYLDFPLPKRFPQPITLRHLLTHTAGFEESGKQLRADSGKGVPLAQAVRSTPHQIYLPGTITAYSNYGADLAGYIVEHVSGLPFAEYIRQNILEPLGMRHSSFAEPLPPDLKPLVSKEYAVASDSAKEFEILQGEPSGNLSSSAHDMAQFMIAHLQLGRYDDRRILKEETARLMATTQFRTHPAVPGMGIGFFEEHRHGMRIIGHGGDLSRFHSHMSLLLDQGVGLFLSVNSAGSGGGLYGAREVIRDGFLNRYFPRREPVEPVVADAGSSRRVAGAYLLSRRGETTLFRLASLAIRLEVQANQDGSVQVPLLTGENGKPIRWYPIGNGVYRTEDGADRIAFATDSSGLTRMAFLGGHELHRTGLANNAVANLWFIGAVLALIAGSLLLWPVAGLIRRRYRQPVPPDGVSPRLRGLTRLTALLDVGFLVGFGIIFMLMFGEKLKPDPSIDAPIRAAQLIALLGMVGIIPTVLACLRSWTQGTSRLARIKYTALLLACLGFTWFILHWNMLIWNLDF